MTCLYFDAPVAPCDAPVLHLEGRRGVGPVNNAHVASAVSEHVAPAGRSLVSVTCLGRHEEPAALRDAALAQLQGWFGEQVTRWRHLRTYDIPFALPAQPVGALEPPRRPVRVDEGLYVAEITSTRPPSTVPWSRGGAPPRRSSPRCHRARRDVRRDPPLAVLRVSAAALPRNTGLRLLVWQTHAPPPMPCDSS